MMIKIISLYDGEEDCMMQVSLDSEYSGVLIYCRNQDNEQIAMVFDESLLKQLCNDVSKIIGSRATKSNASGKVTYA